MHVIIIILIFKTAWSIYRIGCLDLGCEFDCAKNRGCFTYGTTENHEFVFTVNCRDAYGSDVTSTFTLHLEDNQPPYFTADSKNPVYYIALTIK